MTQIKSIVLIDDDKDDAELFREALNEVQSSVDMLHFENARKALSDLGALPSLPDVVFLDINIPSFSGWQFLTEIKKHETLRQLNVIMYTTSSAEREKTIAEDLGAIGFITKPDSYKKLCSLLQTLLATPKEELQRAAAAIS